VRVDHTIESASNPQVKQLVALRDRRARDAAGQFVAEGLRAVERLMAAGRRINTLYVQPDLLDRTAGMLVDLCQGNGTPVVALSAAAMAKASYRERPEGLLAVADQWHDSLPDINLRHNAMVIVAEGVEKPGNLGAILRTADAVGCQAVIVCDPRVDRFNPNVIRAATAVVFSTRVVAASSDEVLAWVRGHGLQLVATTPDTETLHWQADLTGPVAVLMGAEDVGLTDFWLSEADVAVRLPMHGQADSLNVAVATAVVLYEALRQRADHVERSR
jgi:RNA methyltransferase, TrmH family